MSNRLNPHKLIWLFATIMIVSLFATNVMAEYRIDLTVGNAVGAPNETNVRLPIYLSNPLDTVKAFQFWLQLDRPDIAIFNMSVDTAGTLMSGIPVSVNTLSGIGIDALVTGGSLSPAIDIDPQTGSIPLLFLLMDMENVPDIEIDRIANIIPNIAFIDHFSFVNPQGVSIGIETDTATVTECWRCDAWVGETCLSWVRVASPPCDSTYMYLDTIGYIDTTEIHVTAGTITALPPFICGDNNYDGTIDISDLTFIVDYMFRGGPPPIYLMALDCDGNGAFDISDLTCFVCYMFQGCEPPICLGI